LQLLSAAAYARHGMNDAQKGMGIITTALVAGGLPHHEVPYWVIICCHLAMGGGTMARMANYCETVVSASRN
jgi:PiT family inorganic phosphate transporter